MARTRWRASVDDKQPWIKVEVSRRLQANTLVIYQGPAKLKSRSEYAAILKIEVRVNGLSLREVDLSPDIMQPIVVDLGESLGIRSIELRVLAREENTKPVGLSGIQLQERL